MTSIKPGVFLLMSLLGFLAACATPKFQDLPNCEIISDFVGPEDFDVDPSNPRNPRLIVSMQERRSTSPGGEMVEPGYIGYVKTRAPYDFGLFTIENRDEFPFHPHGIAVTTQGRDTILFVINHALIHNPVIESFTVRESKLIFRSRLRSPLLISPNDLVAVSPYELYITNDHGYTGFLGFWEDLFAAPWSNLIHYRMGEWRVAASGFSFANGVYVNPAQDTLALAAVRDKSITLFSRDITTGSLSLKTTLSVPSGPDNLLSSDGVVLQTAAHPSLFAFLSHYRDGTQPSPSEVYSINLNDSSVTKIYSNDGKMFSAASTALIIDRGLFLGQVFNSGLLRCDAPR